MKWKPFEHYLKKRLNFFFRSTTFTNSQILFKKRNKSILFNHNNLRTRTETVTTSVPQVLNPLNSTVKKDIIHGVVTIRQ